MSGPPNIVFILSDQHRGDWMGCAGSRLVETPNLDRLAAGGARFSRAYCNYPLCGPSRMSMLTGRHPFRNGVFINEDFLSSETPTIAHALGLAGYETVLAGRMHFCGPDQRHGFHRRLVGDVTPSLPGAPGLDLGELAGATGADATPVRLAGCAESAPSRFDDDVTAATERFCNEWNEKRPLFLTVGLHGPHNPFNVPEPYHSRAKARMEANDPGPVPPTDTIKKHPFFALRFKGKMEEILTEERIREVRINYAGLIDMLDERIGRILEAVGNLPGPTLVIYASDHGEAAGDHHLFFKRSFFEGALHVPFIISALPGQAENFGIRSGISVDSPVSLVDLSPTVTDFAEAESLPKPEDGLTLMPLLRDPEMANERFWMEREVYAEMTVLNDPPARMVLKGPYKAMYFHDMPPLLFDLAADPSERENLAGQPTMKAVEQDLMHRALAGWDPVALTNQARERAFARDYLTRWGRSAAPSGELWNEENPVYEYAPLGSPLSRLR